MVVPPAAGGQTTFAHVNGRASPAHSTHTATRLKTSTINGNGYHPAPKPASLPLSARRAEPLDLSSVERRGQPHASREAPKRIRPHNLPEAPTFRPTEDEFRDPMLYIQKIAPEGQKYGIVKIIPPDSWNPDFAIDTEKFHFRTRRQELNSVEGGTRANNNYLDQLSKFHKQHGTNLNRFPSVDKRPLDLYKLKKAVEVRGGFEKVCKLKKWAEIGRDLGYSGKIMSSLSTSLKNSYQRWLNPYEEYLKLAKPGVHQQLEHEYGGLLTPSPGSSPMKKSQQHTPSSLHGDTPAIRASSALHTSLSNGDVKDRNTATVEQPRPISSSSFAAVNPSGFTAVNASPSSSFTAVKREPENGLHTPGRAMGSPASSSKNTPEYRPSSLSAAPITNGNGLNHLKRRLSNEDVSVSSEKENADCDSGERRSKRLKREAAPTVAGSYMTMFRPSTPKILGENGTSKPGERCESCGRSDNIKALVTCDGCDNAFHSECMESPPKTPGDEWHCSRCLVGTGDYGFEEGGIYSLKQFQEKASNFKSNHFASKMPFDPVLNCNRPVTEDDTEREFWHLVESLTETVEVEYGADIHSTTHGSGFPTIEKNPLDPYSTDPWNLNILPLHPESLFRHIKSDISGMTVPWLYVGMCFSTFCWHNEDHYTYSANYQHFGATKTWYGIPAEDAERFENTMHEAVPELFETQPDLLFQLVTLLSPDQLRKAGVRVYALDQRAGQFVVTFPQAYHAGFNHGFNFNEAVNFAPHDWEPSGEAGVERLQQFRREPCFSHDELLLTAAARDTTIKTAKWLGPALERLRRREGEQRAIYQERHESMDGHDFCELMTRGKSEHHAQCQMGISADTGADDFPEEDYQCAYCKTYSYLSHFRCGKSQKVVCVLHAGDYECCDIPRDRRLLGDNHSLVYRVTDKELTALVQKVTERARAPEAWQEKLEKTLEDDPKPALKTLRSLLSEGEKIPYEIPQLPALKAFVDRCNEWVEEAMNYVTRKQQNRRKNEKAWRKGNSAKAAELEERDRELRKVENITKLLADAEEISFDCPEIGLLQDRADNIADFRKDALFALENPRSRTTQEIEDMVELGRSFNVDIPEVEKLDQVVQQMKWNDTAREHRNRSFLSLQDVEEIIASAKEFAIPDHNDHLVHFKEQQVQGELWEAKAKELMSVESVHYQQLEALANQASSIPVSRETYAAVDQILNKQREAHKQIVSLYERSKDPDFRKRPKYKDVREVMETLVELNSKPTGTIDLEKEQKRHEDWMRKGKKLFGKANAPLHILIQHMNYVEQRNLACFNLQDRPRTPVEPSSREHTPEPSMSTAAIDSSSRNREVFCICRQPEAGMMIECELCHEWYHGKCLKIARGKVKEDDKYTCPICDWRIKIPRDAARPKLEDLQEWQAEIPSLPFQPDEEECLSSIVSTAYDFRDFMKPLLNNLMTTPEEVPTQRFYLRKVEGAEVLLAWETNFFRQELHRWAPVAPNSPPLLEHSHSTRKPRPTKQQKVMASLGITDPDKIPQSLRTKQHSFPNKRKSQEPHARHAPPPLRPAPGGDAATHTQQTSPGGTVTVTSNGASSAPLTNPHGHASFAYDGAYGLISPNQASPSFTDAAGVFRSPSFGVEESPGGMAERLFGAGVEFEAAEEEGDEVGEGVDEMFKEMTNHDGAEDEEDDRGESGLAGEALAVTAGGEGGGERSALGQDGEGLGDDVVPGDGDVRMEDADAVFVA